MPSTTPLATTEGTSRSSEPPCGGASQTAETAAPCTEAAEASTDFSPQRSRSSAFLSQVLLPFLQFQ
ncbi:hypothetical protein ACF3DV_08770 [Chlorogloeopsis fritschii PCC 9212]|uniref:hypothetical protein n=1 Tax=Chlorogloeopsis fritschii TaxID=1124 RepID=UPI000F8CFF50|nr:hypothetical protein [Chlorogloeopsis fritschii]